ncbi:MAG: hypothetical protein WCT07_01260 [Candidatus Paceibacterota bacterium]
MINLFETKWSFAIAVSFLLSSFTFFVRWLFFQSETLGYATYALGISIPLFTYTFFRWTKLGREFLATDFSKSVGKKTNNVTPKKGQLLISNQKGIDWKFIISKKGMTLINTALVVLLILSTFLVGYSTGNWWVLVILVIAGVVYGVTYYKKWGAVVKWLKTKLLPALSRFTKKKGGWVFDKLWKLVVYFGKFIGEALTGGKGVTLCALSWFIASGAIYWLTGGEVFLYFCFISGISFFFLLFSAPARKANKKIKVKS